MSKCPKHPNSGILIKCDACDAEQKDKQAKQITELSAEINRLKETLNEEVMFEKIWQATKHWDLDNGRPIKGTNIRGYAGMTGDDVRVIIKALKTAQPQKKITDHKLRCPDCGLVEKVGECIPDADGDGSIGCPRCYYVLNEKDPCPIMQEIKAAQPRKGE